MLTVFIYSLMCYGISSALVYYTGPFGIFEKWRQYVSEKPKLNELFSCMFCLPVNIGIVMSILSTFLSPLTPFTPFTVLFGTGTVLWPLVALFDGFYTGAIVSIIDTFVEMISDNGEIDDNKQILND